MISQDDNLNLSEKVSSSNVTDEREARPKFWVAAYTRPRSEKKAALELAKSGIETYVPIQKRLRIWSDRKKYIDVVVIPMIIFARISDGDIQKIREHSLIIRIISQSGRKGAAHIPTDQIDSLKHMLGQSEIPVAFEQEHFKSDEEVCIVSGCLRGLTGQIKAVKDDMTEVWVSIDLLGGTIIKIKSSELEHISS